MGAAIKNRFVSGPDSEKGEQTIHGVKLSSVPKGLIKIFDRLTTSKDPKHYPQRTFAVPEGCSDFECAVTAVFGKELGIRLAYMLMQHGYNGSQFSGIAKGWENSYALQPFRINELDDILLELEALPPSFRNLVQDHPLVRGLDTQGIPGESARSTIIFFRFEAGRTNRQMTLLHEVAHVFSELYWGQADLKPEWLDLSGWKRTRSWQASKKECMVSGYGASSPEEDFAESVVAYRYLPKQLEKACPAKYKFLKQKVFDGVEYKSGDLCQGNDPVPIRDPGPREGLRCAPAGQQYVLIKLATKSRLGNSAFSSPEACWSALQSAREGVVCAPFSYGVAPARISSGVPLGQAFKDEGGACISALTYARNNKMCWHKKGGGAAGLISLVDGALLKSMPIGACYETELLKGGVTP